MNANKTRIVGDKVICTINPANGTRWTIHFPSYLYDFLREHVGDVHRWAEQQRGLIMDGTLPFKHPLSAQIKRGEKPTQRAIGNVVRAYGTNLLLDTEDSV